MNKEDDLSRHQNNSSQINDTKNDLRTGAEALITKEEKRSFENLEELSLKEIISIVHELKVHQIELEMQNEELQRIQLELDHAKARYFDIYDLAPEGYLIVSEKGLILESNLTAANMLGVTRTNLIKQRLSQYIYKEDQNKYYIHRKKQFETLIPEECELRITRNDGTVFWGHMKATVVTEEGLPVCRLILSDISARKEAELALKESQSIMLAAFENSQAGIAIADAPDGKLRYVNKAGLLIRDKSEEEIVKGIDVHNYVAAWKMLHFDGKPLAEDEVPLVRAVLYGETCSEEFIIRRDNLEDRYVLANAAPIKDSNNNIIAGIVVFLDITERKQIEVQLKQNIDDLLESQRIAHLGTWRLNLVTNHVVWSEELYKMYGFDPTIPPPPYTEHMKLFTPESWDILSTSLERTSTSGIPYELELETVTKDGSNGWMWVRGEAEKDSNGNIISLRGAAQDITESKQTKNELLKFAEEVEQQRKDLEERLNQSVNAISKIGELRDVYTAGHQKRVAELVCTIGREMRLADKKISNLSYGGLLHDVGKFFVPSDILNKPGKVSELEYKILQTHVEESYSVVKEINFPEEIHTMIYQHHERLDGSGYPQGLSGDEIILESRILSVADVVEAMTSHRPYRAALSIDTALEEILQNRGTKYDAEVVDICIRLFRENKFQFIEK